MEGGFRITENLMDRCGMVLKLTAGFKAENHRLWTFHGQLQIQPGEIRVNKPTGV